jgi:hypothetical protein
MQRERMDDGTNCRGQAEVDAGLAGRVYVAEADDGLPTTMMTVGGEQRFVKLDSCARFSVAGTDWMAFGDKMDKCSPVDYVERIDGFTLAVLGMWSFVFRNIYGQNIAIEACIVEGCTSEFLLGVDFMARHRATMDLRRKRCDTTIMDEA